MNVSRNQSGSEKNIAAANNPIGPGRRTVNAAAAEPNINMLPNHTQVTTGSSLTSSHGINHPDFIFNDPPFSPGDDGDLEYCEFQVDDIKGEHHPNSGIPTKVHVFGDFKSHPAHYSSWSTPEPDAQPWCPFTSRLEFDITEIALEAALNNSQTDCLLDICRHYMVSIPFADASWYFDVYYHDLWEWATDLLHDPYLFPHFHFDAQCLSKFNGRSFEHFVDEPFTAQNFWDAQSQLLPDAKPLTFILYADKMKLSSFSTAKGYPVIARLANLPTDIRNGQGTGGGYVVGWLPVVKEDKQHSGKPAWANFKATVWHKCFKRILSSLAAKSNMGQWLECLQCHSLEVSGPFGHAPSVWYHTTNLVISTAQVKETAEEREEILKEYGLCDILNALWTMKSTDVHHALSWDKLHFHSGGEWLDHLHFEAILHQYIDKTANKNGKNCNFPKLHMDLHIFNDVEAKGATRNYNTKPNEKMHSSLKDSYLLWTNFRDVAEQILRINQWQVIADHIHRLLFEFDEHQCQLHADDLLESEEDFIMHVVEHPISTNSSFHVKLGSKQPLETFDAIEKLHQDDQVFHNFRINLNEFLNILLPSSDIPLPEDYLWCNPLFFGSPRFDCVFIWQTEDKVILGRLLFLFECLIGDRNFPLALIHPFDAPTDDAFGGRAHWACLMSNIHQPSQHHAHLLNTLIRALQSNMEGLTFFSFNSQSLSLSHAHLLNTLILSAPQSNSCSPSWLPSQNILRAILFLYWKLKSQTRGPQNTRTSLAVAYTSSFCIMLHLSGNTFDDDSDEEPFIESVAIPGPNASKGDLIEALKALQVQVQKLIEDNCTLPPDELAAHEQIITLYARKYDLTVEMFPNPNLLSKPRPENPTPFDSRDRYLTAMTQESAFLNKLFHHFPNRVHSAMESLYFSDLVMKSISEAHSSEINKLCGVTGDIFGLPGMYFTNTNYRRADEDLSLKTVFRNWELLAKVLKAALRGITSLHQEISGRPKTNRHKWNFKQVTPGSIAWAAVIKSGLGKSSGINYKDLFYHYKKLLLTKWDSRRIQTIVQNINREVFGSAKSSASGPAGQENHSSEIIRTMNALDMDSDSESDVPMPSSTAQAATASWSDVIKAAQPPEHFVTPPLSAASTLSSASTLSTASRKHAKVPVMMGLEATTTAVMVQDSDVGPGPEQPTQGRGKMRAKKLAAPGVRHGTHTC
ncbi:uncharacterized protein F5891DRAFT_974216 [Suillus fuscotomentosus]|uniref:Uncharacterized protein n=1 Tax=Suillus fuscotomentosus TaxID=1912939 RepID=A0AAD4EMK1_9AGAM|nr:uncharacterized protein F5891DRAFT_974216 [Suillus fuscotomentosus]KAG1908935.1 hypothetical protein F5891DRAFT_974216 [Suillus fuscotomentosus]